METYVPTSPGGGILGGQGADGELDGIQAWKKGMKEKERKEKGVSPETGKGTNAKTASDRPASSAASSAPTSDSPMDEIQLFKLMMKREAEKKEGDKPQNGILNYALADSGPPGLSSSPSLQSQKSDTNGAGMFL